MQIDTQLDSVKLSVGSYVSMETFLEHLQSMNLHPYTSVFSFEPFIKRYLARLDRDGLDHLSKEAIARLSQLDLASQEVVDRNTITPLIALYLPSLYVHDGLTFINSPFKKDFVYLSPGAEEILTTSKWQLQVVEEMVLSMTRTSIYEIGITILNQCYGQNVSCDLQNTIRLRHIDTGLERCYQLKMDFSYVEVRPIKKVKAIGSSTIRELLNNPDQTDLWIQYFPPENFEIHGFLMGSLIDDTRRSMLAEVTHALNNGAQNQSPTEFLPNFSKILCNYLGITDLALGFVGVRFARQLGSNSFSLTQHNDIQLLGSNGSAPGGIYHECIQTRKVVYYEDLSSIADPSYGEKRLLQHGFRSVILFPPQSSDGDVPMVYEIGSSTAHALNQQIIDTLQPIFAHMQEASDHFLEEVEKNVSLFIQQHFTSIHPSVLWKFEQVAQNYHLQQRLPDFDGSIDEVAFSEVNPLYGQADIVGSSEIRNQSIRNDLVENLMLAKKLLGRWKKEVKLHLLSVLIDRIAAAEKRIRQSFISRDETEIIELLHQEVHPYLSELQQQYPKILQREHESYFEKLDGELQIIYHERRKYEQSVSRLNQLISNLLDEEDAKLQEILPHYFEKYKTDGVEYNMYVGQSLLHKGQFHKNHLREFRIWQLVQMCEITRLVETHTKQLPIPLTTAQLIFVYNSPLSIRFRMDEKQFDVDGTYNVRYEILKKRIDKAKVRGREERLTQPQTVSIVYLQEKDRHEYQGYLQYLIDHGFIFPDFEDLELEKLQGAEGLRALRVSVKPN